MAAHYQHEQTAEDTRLPEVASESGLEAAYPTPTPYRGDEYPEYISTPSDVVLETKPGNANPADSYGKTRRSYCFGLSRKAFWITIGVLFVVLAAALGGGLGGALSHRSSSDKSTSNTTPSVNQPPGDLPPGNNTKSELGPFLNSQLAATNWTGSDGEARRAVFYQSAGSLLVSVVKGSDDTETWTQVNITALFEQDADWSPPRDGTPLAATAVPWQGLDQDFFVGLFYIDVNGLVRQLNSKPNDYDIQGWIRGPEWDVATTHAAGNDSRLSSVAYYCPTGCLQHQCITYQDAGRQVWLACGDNWLVRKPMVIAYPGSPLSIITLPNLPMEDGETEINVLRCFYYTDTDIRDFNYNVGGNGTFIQDPITIVSSLQSGGSADTLPQVAASPYDSFAKNTVIAREYTGNIIVSWWYNDWNLNKRANFINEDGSTTQDSPNVNLSAIEMDYDHHFYSVAADGSKIIQYEWTSDSPLWFNWTSTVISA
ncbi:hypothetical protein F4808DRAFT_438544 [Astrocystis sublimbata]|nr:hypothetical protein F4808DRAFT_438544 [Astrocystis sublimbata]